MLFLVDEDVPRSVADFLRQQAGFEVREVTAEPELRGKKDHVLAAIGDAEGAVLVTWNARDYKRITSRRRPKGAERLRNLGTVSFKCTHPLGRHRIEQVLDAIVFEYERQLQQRDRRMFIEIHKDLFRVLR